MGYVFYRSIIDLCFQSRKLIKYIMRYGNHTNGTYGYLHDFLIKIDDLNCININLMHNYLSNH